MKTLVWMAAVMFGASACSDDGLATQHDATDGPSPTEATGGLGNDDDGADASADDGRGTTSGLDDSGDSDETGTDDGGQDRPYCPEVDPWPRGSVLCTSQAECQPAESCDANGPPEGPQCGACSVPEIPCVDDDACVDLGMVCAPTDHPCACRPGALGCVASCFESGCEADRVCQPDGHCVPMACDDGWACDGRSQTCDPAAANADPHGCAPISCAAGWRCEPGWACEPAANVGDPHGCVAIHCTEPGGVRCPANFDCDPELAGSGCALRPCATALECDCGSCVEGWCREKPGVCVPPPPP